MATRQYPSETLRKAAQKRAVASLPTSPTADQSYYEAIKRAQAARNTTSTSSTTPNLSAGDDPQNNEAPNTGAGSASKFAPKGPLKQVRPVPGVGRRKGSGFNPAELR
ncbi:MAG TPA: hypothetical protein VFK94_02340, partial [Patescibacteria group bacterium]|nr:hypothetical protein [Patescibacteria group bacterium]